MSKHLHFLIQVSSDEHVGSLAENLLEALRAHPGVASRVEEVREQTRAEKKRLAMAMREKQLGSMGMKTNEKGQVKLITHPLSFCASALIRIGQGSFKSIFIYLFSYQVLFNLYDFIGNSRLYSFDGRHWRRNRSRLCYMQRRIPIPTFKGIIIKILIFSLHFKNNLSTKHCFFFIQVLGIYTFTKRCNVEEFEARPRKTTGYSTVTHFNVVHVDCHMAAVRLARARDEWESAALQNANTKCNGLLPLWGPQVPESAFASCLARHNTYLQVSLLKQLNYFRILV